MIEEGHDVLIRGGLLLDGTGAPGQRGDVAICDGRIRAMGRDLPGTAAKLIDARGLAVAPGFIDIKTHSDFTLPINPKAESKVRQGVTTEIEGRWSHDRDGGDAAVHPAGVPSSVSRAPAPRTARR